MNVARELIASHCVSVRMTRGHEIGLHIDQTLTQDATGTLVMLELEAMGLDRIKTEVSRQYLDHRTLASGVTSDEKDRDHGLVRSKQ